MALFQTLNMTKPASVVITRVNLDFVDNSLNGAEYTLFRDRDGSGSPELSVDFNTGQIDIDYAFVTPGQSTATVTIYFEYQGIQCQTVPIPFEPQFNGVVFTFNVDGDRADFTGRISKTGTETINWVANEQTYTGLNPLIEGTGIFTISAYIKDPSNVTEILFYGQPIVGDVTLPALPNLTKIQFGESSSTDYSRITSFDASAASGNIKGEFIGIGTSGFNSTDAGFVLLNARDYDGALDLSSFNSIEGTIVFGRTGSNYLGQPGKGMFNLVLPSNNPTPIELAGNDNNLQGVLDLTGSRIAGQVSLSDNPLLEDVAFNMSVTNTSYRVNLSDCGLIGTLNLSSFVFSPLNSTTDSSLMLDDNNSLQNIVFHPANSGEVTYFYVRRCDLQGVIDASTLSANGLINFSDNQDLENLVFKDSGSGAVQTYSAENSSSFRGDVTKQLDLSSLAMEGNFMLRGTDVRTVIHKSEISGGSTLRYIKVYVANTGIFEKPNFLDIYTPGALQERIMYSFENNNWVQADVDEFLNDMNMLIPSFPSGTANLSQITLWGNENPSQSIIDNIIPELQAKGVTVVTSVVYPRTT